MYISNHVDYNVYKIIMYISHFFYYNRIYLCCGHKRDKSKTPPIRPPRVSYNESQVSDANTGITRSKTRFSQGDGMSVDDRGFFLSPIYTKPTVR